MRALEIITGHVIYNPTYTYKFQLKTTIDSVFVSGSYKVQKGSKTHKNVMVFINDRTQYVPKNLTLK